jgi:ComF family protein
LTLIKKYKFQLIRDLVHLIYPEKCLVCEEELSKLDTNICSFCSQELERTHFDKHTDPSPMDRLFWGRVKIESTYAHYYFKKQGGTQKLLFSLKYGKNEMLGLYLGEEVGKVLSQSPNKYTFDALLPVPLHPKRQFKRGYNQSYLLAKGIANYTGTKIDTSSVKRRANNKTQTGKTRFERWDNVSSIFQIHHNNLNSYNHVAIIDDVITTGSTIESLVNEIHKLYPTIKISVVTLALA